MNIIIDRLFHLASTAVAAGERPMAAILVRDSEIVREAIDNVFRGFDPTGHAERRVIREFCSRNRLLHLRGYELYTFCEPCMQCCGAIHWAKLSKVVYCLSQERLKSVSGGNSKPGIGDLLPLGKRELEIVGPVRETEALKIASQYDWKGKAI